VPDLKPPRSVDGERATLQDLLQFQRDSVVRKISGVDEEKARRALVPSGTTLLWLVKHLAGAEAIWVLYRFAGTHPVPDRTVTADDTVASAVDDYRATWAEVDAVVAATPSLDAVCSNLPEGEEQVSLRWILLHLLEETARHAGHADIIREQIDGHTGR
jgi:hypothetical protein